MHTFSREPYVVFWTAWWMGVGSGGAKVIFERLRQPSGIVTITSSKKRDSPFAVSTHTTGLRSMEIEAQLSICVTFVFSCIAACFWAFSATLLTI